MTEPLVAPYVLEYTYHRSTGPIVGRFLGGLVDGQVIGARTARGRVVVPALEWDPLTSEPTTDFVTVGQEGVVVAHTWVHAPRVGHPRTVPFAFALVRLDGADTPMLHVVDAPSRAAVRNGTRVRVRFAAERVGAITDIDGFDVVPEAP